MFDNKFELKDSISSNYVTGYINLENLLIYTTDNSYYKTIVEKGI